MGQELEDINLEDIDLEELSVRLSKLSAEKDLLYELINKTDYNLLREEFDSNKRSDIKQKQNLIRLLSNKIFMFIYFSKYPLLIKILSK